MTHRLALLAISLIVATPIMAASSTTIGYVDMQKVLEQSKLGQQAQERLETEFGPQRNAFAQEELAIRQMQQTLERDKPLMSKEQIDKKEREIQERIQAFQKDVSSIQEKILAEQQEISERIIGPAVEAVNEVAGKRKVSAVFERNRAGLLYVDDAIDLTDAVVKQLDASTK